MNFRLLSLTSCLPFIAIHAQHTACNFPHTYTKHTYFLANCDPLIRWGRDKTALGPFKELLCVRIPFTCTSFGFTLSLTQNTKNFSLITRSMLIINFHLTFLSRQDLKLNHFSICLHILRALLYAGNTLRNASTTKTKRILCVSHKHWELSTRKSFFIDPMISEWVSHKPQVESREKSLFTLVHGR